MGGTQQADIKLVTPEGTLIWARLQRQVQNLEETDTPCISAVVIDFTEEMRQEQRRSETLVTAAAAEMAIQTIEGMIDPVIILNEQGLVERVNKGYIDVVGPAKDIVGKNVASLFQDIDEKKLAPLLVRCKEEGQIRNLEARLMDHQGKVLPVLVNISRLRDSQQAINGFVIAIRDVSSLVAASEQLRENSVNWMLY
jgi:PAS domain S-box-containing protein